MIVILIATNRPGSNTGKVAVHLQDIYRIKNIPFTVLDLHELPPEVFAPTSYAEKPASLAPFQEKMSQASGIHIVIPEYNGGFPGVLKYFVDLLKFPETLEGVPVAFIGVSAGIWGALRPIEQFGDLVIYRRGILYPERVHLSSINQHLDEQGRVKTPDLVSRLEKQTDGFFQFVKQLGRL